MFFLGEPFLPNPAVFPAYLAAVGEYFRQARKLTAEEVLLSFFERALAPATFHIDSVHHVAVYLGDYLREEDFECWLAFLEQTDQVRDIQSGPSYISPRHYGAPGYWINCQMDDAELEMFSCKHVGTWADFDTTERQSRNPTWRCRSRTSRTSGRYWNSSPTIPRSTCWRSHPPMSWDTPTVTCCTGRVNAFWSWSTPALSNQHGSAVETGGRSPWPP